MYIKSLTGFDPSIGGCLNPPNINKLLPSDVLVLIFRIILNSPPYHTDALPVTCKQWQHLITAEIDNPNYMTTLYLHYGLFLPIYSKTPLRSDFAFQMDLNCFGNRVHRCKTLSQDFFHITEITLSEYELTFFEESHVVAYAPSEICIITLEEDGLYTLSRIRFAEVTIKNYCVHLGKVFCIMDSGEILYYALNDPECTSHLLLKLPKFKKETIVREVLADDQNLVIFLNDTIQQWNIISGAFIREYTSESVQHKLVNNWIEFLETCQATVIHNTLFLQYSIGKCLCLFGIDLRNGAFSLIHSIQKPEIYTGSEILCNHWHISWFEIDLTSGLNNSFCTSYNLHTREYMSVGYRAPIDSQFGSLFYGNTLVQHFEQTGVAEYNQQPLHTLQFLSLKDDTYNQLRFELKDECVALNAYGSYQNHIFYATHQNSIEKLTFLITEDNPIDTEEPAVEEIEEESEVEETRENKRQRTH